MKELDFTAFFREVHGVAPLPWQARLAQQLIENDDWPEVIDLPTASGKTACIDIALFHLAWCASRGDPWRAARRIAFVVDRRIIVDAAAERAERIRIALQESRSEAVSSVARALRAAGGDDPLICLKLRGGMAREQGVALNPAQPMIITSTIDQVGSRLLFRGYGLSPYATPLHAGLLGHDTLILLDEAHLGEPFTATVSAIVREQSRAESTISPIRPVKLVEMTATSRSTGSRFTLDASDLAHPLIAARRTAPKPARLVNAKSKGNERIKVLAREALGLLSGLDGPVPAVAVIVNRVKTAREVFEQLGEEAGKRNFELQLLIGRSRPIERDALAGQLLTRLGAAREIGSAERGLIVVATQTIEVGADLDFQGMVTECASIDALRQRFGRLDRFGRYRKAGAVIVGGGESDDDPVYGAAVGATWDWLESIAVSADGCATVDFSIEAMDQTLAGVDMQPLMGDARETIELTPTFVRLLCQTSPRPVYEPDVAGLLHGLEAALPEVQVVWRADIPVRAREGHFFLDDARREVAYQLLELNPPSSLEAMSLPLHAVRAWLDEAKEEVPVADMEGTLDPAPTRAAGSTSRLVLRRKSGGWEMTSSGRIRPGDTLVVPSAYGGCDHFGFAPRDRAAVRDLSSLARAQLGRSKLHVISEATMLAEDPVVADAQRALWKRLREAHRKEGADSHDLLELYIEGVAESLQEDLLWLKSDPLTHTIVGADDDSELEALVVTERGAKGGDISDEDLSSSRTVPVRLEDHGAGVGRRTRILAKSVGLEGQHVRTLGCAGDLHDIGKADPRFQSLLRAGNQEVLRGQLLAKGLRRAGPPGVELGERHEAYSVAFIRTHEALLERASDPELALYLVGTHHGRGRALMPDRTDDGVAFSVAVGNVTYAFDGVPRLGALGSDWPSLFWQLNRRYGPWGLAYLEAVLRLADRLQSAAELNGESRA